MVVLLTLCANYNDSNYILMYRCRILSSFLFLSNSTVRLSRTLLVFFLAFQKKYREGWRNSLNDRIGGFEEWILASQRIEVRIFAFVSTVVHCIVCKCGLWSCEVVSLFKLKIWKVLEKPCPFINYY